MAHSCADFAAEGIKNDLSGDEKEDSKGNITQWPSVVQRSGHQKDLHAHVYEQLNGIQQIQDDKQADGVGWVQTSPSFESGERNEEADGKRNERANSHHPDREWRAILVQLEPDKPVDKQACYQRIAQTILYADKVGKRSAGRRNNSSINDQRDEGQEHVNVEEG